MDNEKLQSIATEDQIEDVAGKVLGKLIEKLKDDLSDSFYEEMKSYLYEHYTNFEDEIFEEVFKFICGYKWSRYKDHHNANNLRALLYKEHKEELDKMISEQVVQESIKRYFGLFLMDEEKTEWRYRGLKDAISKWIYINLGKNECKLKKMMDQKLVNENDKLRVEVSRLNSIVSSIGQIVEE